MKKNFIFFIVLIGIISLIFDIIDLPTKLGLYFNLDYWNIYVVIFLFIVGYYLIDKKSLDKENNKKALLEYFIKDTYERCLNMLNLIERNIKTVNKLFNYKITKDEKSKLQDFNIYKDVYKHEEHIYELLKEGVGDKKTIEEYFNIYSKYMKFVWWLANYNDNTEEGEKLIKDLKEILLNKEM